MTRGNHYISTHDCPPGKIYIQNAYGDGGHFDRAAFEAHVGMTIEELEKGDVAWHIAAKIKEFFDKEF